MSGIIGYIGNKRVVPVLLEGLERLQYRGYDSAGIAVVEDGRLAVEKAAGKIVALEQRLDGNIPRGRTAIAHTRWATHGAPTDTNAHPHTDCGGTIAVVHNGIIENAGLLREQLQARGHAFRSQTDTEGLAHLIEEAYQESLELAVAAALGRGGGADGVGRATTDTVVAVAISVLVLDFFLTKLFLAL